MCMSTHVIDSSLQFQFKEFLHEFSYASIQACYADYILRASALLI